MSMAGDALRRLVGRPCGSSLMPYSVRVMPDGSSLWMHPGDSAGSVSAGGWQGVEVSQRDGLWDARAGGGAWSPRMRAWVEGADSRASVAMLANYRGCRAFGAIRRMVHADALTDAADWRWSRCEVRLCDSTTSPMRSPTA